MVGWKVKVAINHLKRWGVPDSVLFRYSGWELWRLYQTRGGENIHESI